jgi:hypothetical protein
MTDSTTVDPADNDGQSTEEATTSEEAVETAKSSESEEATTSEETVETAKSSESEEATTSEEGVLETDHPEHVSKKEHEKRVGKLTQKKYEAEQETEYWKRVALSKQDIPQDNSQETQQEPQTKELDNPKPEDFESDDEYYRALTDYRVQEALKAEKAKNAQITEWERQRQIREKYNADSQRTLAMGKEKYPDDYEVVSQSPPYSQVMRQLVVESEMSADIAYYLGKNHETSRRIALLPALQAAKEIGKIEALLGRTAKKTTKAPAPINPIGGIKEVVNKDPEKMTTKEWMEERNRQLRANK